MILKTLFNIQFVILFLFKTLEKVSEKCLDKKHEHEKNCPLPICCTCRYFRIWPCLPCLNRNLYFRALSSSQHSRYDKIPTSGDRVCSLPFFLCFFGSSFMGDLSDILGRRKVLMLCMAGFVIGYLGMAFGVETKSLGLLFSGRALTGNYCC